MKRCLAIILFLPFLSCATVSHENLQKPGSLTIADISDGLPREGLWREALALADMNGDGFLDIVAPPPRKGAGRPGPFIFLWNPAQMKWVEGNYTFKTLENTTYAYGGIAVGDLTRSGHPDIVLAVHAGTIIILEHNGNGGFVERPFPGEASIEPADDAAKPATGPIEVHIPAKPSFPAKDVFHSRAVEVADINGDGWPDIIAFSEASFSTSYKPRGILVGMNRGGKEWDVRILAGSPGMYGDSMAIGDLRGEGRKDILVAPFTLIKEYKKPVWFGDGSGKFSAYEGDLLVNDTATFVRAGDLDGDGKDEVIFKRSGVGASGTLRLSAFKWTGEGFADISSGLEKVVEPIAFDLADVDGDGKKELIVLSEGGLGIYKYADKVWAERASYRLSQPDTVGASDLRAGRNRDGSVFIVYNLGRTDPALNHGIKAFVVK